MAKGTKLAKADDTAAKEAEDASQRHRTEPLPGSLTAVAGYPKKLKLYKLEASPYWWICTFHNSKIYRKSTKTEVKRDAIAFAKGFYESVISGRALTPQREQDVVTFEKVAAAMMKSKLAQVARDDVTNMTNKIMDYRLKEVIQPALGSREIASIHLEDLEELLNDLSHRQLSGSTINGYMKTAKSLLSYAFKRREKPSIPHLPNVDADHQPRDYFTKPEYRKICDRVQVLIGKRFGCRKLTYANGEELIGQ